MSEAVGVVGLGIMGSAFSSNLIEAGYEVFGRDTDPMREDAFTAKGGTALASPAAVIEAAPIVITSLPSSAALEVVVSGPDGLASAGREDAVVIECSTFPIDAKERARDALVAAGTGMLDCPVSGTGSQAAVKDIAVYASGEEKDFKRVESLFEAFSKAAFYVGPFGHGSKLKFIANLLVHIHNASTAEAMVLGMKAGLDPQLIFDVIQPGAGNSRIFELRGPMMVQNDYQPATMKMDVWRKDMEVIGKFARDMDAPVPLFAAAEQIYHAALAAGMGADDTAAICAIYEDMAGVKR